MKPYEKRLLVKVLEMASDKFSNHGCNDFDLEKAGLTKGEIAELHERMVGSGCADGELAGGRWVMDWALMDHLRKVVVVRVEADK